MPSPHASCPRLLSAFQLAAALVVDLIVLPRRSGKLPLDLFLVNLVRVGHETGGAIPLALLAGDDPRVREKAIIVLEAQVLRELAKGAAVWLLVGGPAVAVTEIPDELMPEGDLVEVLARLVEHDGRDANDPYVLGAAALNRWNAALAILSEPRIWQLTRKAVEVLLADDQITPDQLDQIIDANDGVAELLDDYHAAVIDVVKEWHPERLSGVSEVAS